MHAVPGNMGLLLSLPGKKSSKTGNSQEMLRSTSWEVRFLTAPVSSPTGCAHSISCSLGGQAQAGCTSPSPPVPHGRCSLEMHIPVWAARTGSQAQQRYCRGTPATFHPLLNRACVQDFLKFKHLPSQKPRKFGDSPHRLLQCYWDDF